mmetsp:Transcript_4845/g.17018  ORF Transcript_4845/g.17018 Transcript_4845/m.17018 type:complete len:213 (+) Transcript_4845:2301-2939(+)
MRPKFWPSMACMWSSRSLLARIPPWTAGCRVLTRPSSISGKFVIDSTWETATPPSLIARKLPPVLTISYPRSTRPRARSTTPLLSDTDTSTFPLDPPMSVLSADALSPSLATALRAPALLPKQEEELLLAALLATEDWSCAALLPHAKDLGAAALAVVCKPLSPVSVLLAHPFISFSAFPHFQRASERSTTTFRLKSRHSIRLNHPAGLVFM